MPQDLQIILILCGVSFIAGLMLGRYLGQDEILHKQRDGRKRHEEK